MQKLFFSLRLSSEFHFVKVDLICLLKQSRHLKQIFDDFQLNPLFLEVKNSLIRSFLLFIKLIGLFLKRVTIFYTIVSNSLYGGLDILVESLRIDRLSDLVGCQKRCH